MSGEGFGSLDADADMTSAMARELLQKGRVGELANAVWRDMGRERAKHLTVQTAPLPVLFPLPARPLATIVAERLERQSPSHGSGLLEFVAPKSDTLSAMLDPYAVMRKRKRIFTLPEAEDASVRVAEHGPVL